MFKLMDKKIIAIFTLYFFVLTGPMVGTVNLEIFMRVLYRGSYMSAHVLLNLLNELGKRNKM